MSDVAKRHERVSGLIVNYLDRNPDAQDTVEGIMVWWLACGIHDSSRGDVAEAMEDLVREGIITTRVSGDGTVLYKLNKDSQPCTS